MVLPTLSGEVEVAVDEGVSRDAVCAAVVKELTALRARRLEVDEGRIAFSGGLLRLVSSLNLLVPVTHGLIEIERNGSHIRLAYRITFEELFAACAVLSVAMATAIVATGGPFWFPFVFAAWLILGNVFTLWVRFPRFLRRVATGARTPASCPP